MTDTEIPMSCEEFAEHLADYLEHDLDEGTRAHMDLHSRNCAGCGSLLADLRALTVSAAKLPPLTPSRDLWAGISERIETPVVALPTGEWSVQRGPRRAWRGAWTALAAAGLVAVTATVTYELTSRSSTRTPPPVAMTPAPDSPMTIPAANRQTLEQTYDVEITRLRDVVKQRANQLDPATVEVLDKNLKVIDDAIAQCKDALRSDPNSRFLIESLSDALESKLLLLRKAAALPTKA